MFLKKLCLNQSERNGIRIKVKFMKDFFKAYKLYIKVNYPSLILWFYLFFTVVSLGYIFICSVNGFDNSKDYMSALSVVGMFHLVFGLTEVLKNISNLLKFFQSTKFAKLYHTKVKTLAIFSFCIAYDILTELMAVIFIGTDFALDLLIVNAVSTLLICLYEVLTVGDGALCTLGMVLWIVYCVGGIGFLEKFFPNSYGFDLPGYAPVFIAVGIYITTIIVSVKILTHWWENSERNFRYGTVIER